MSIDISLKAPSKYAKRKDDSDKTDDFRTEFMRDRDRMLSSKAFRRLGGKTQIFNTNYDDHVRTRLTHTLEVAQLSRNLAKRLNLDEYLTEAIALGHDLGHAPFGHVGEQVINYVMNDCDLLFGEEVFNNYEGKGFKHNLQGVRLLVELERAFKKSPGLNLTNFTLFGVKEHTESNYDDCKPQKERRK